MCVCVGTVDVFMWCVCMFKYTWNACGSQRTTWGAGPHLLPYLRKVLFLVCCCICQASGPMSFQGFSFLCLHLSKKHGDHIHTLLCPALCGFLVSELIS